MNDSTIPSPEDNNKKTYYNTFDHSSTENAKSLIPVTVFQTLAFYNTVFPPTMWQNPPFHSYTTSYESFYFNTKTSNI